MTPALGLLAIAVVVAATMWLALAAVPRADLNVLPERVRRRISWWQLHVRWIYACCAVVAVAASYTHFSG